MLGKLREKYQKMMTPIGKTLTKVGISPNVMTALTILPALASYFVYSAEKPVYGGLMIILTGLLDMMDGAIARSSNKVTRFGATFDHVLDRYSEFLIIFGIISGNYSNWEVGLFALFGMLMASFTRAKAESVGGLKKCTVGLAERQEKLLLLIAGSFFVNVFPEALTYALIIAGCLSHITVVQRLHYTWIQTGEN